VHPRDDRTGQRTAVKVVGHRKQKGQAVQEDVIDEEQQRLAARQERIQAARRERQEALAAHERSLRVRLSQLQAESEAVMRNVKATQEALRTGTHKGKPLTPDAITKVGGWSNF
jgi:DNA repair exonuclease SbcCD ATPase subunit